MLLEVVFLILPKAVEKYFIKYLKKNDGNFGYVKSFRSFASDYDRSNRNKRTDT